MSVLQDYFKFVGSTKGGYRERVALLERALDKVSLEFYQGEILVEIADTIFKEGAAVFPAELCDYSQDDRVAQAQEVMK